MKLSTIILSLVLAITSFTTTSAMDYPQGYSVQAYDYMIDQEILALSVSEPALEVEGVVGEGVSIAISYTSDEEVDYPEGYSEDYNNMIEDEVLFFALVPNIVDDLGPAITVHEEVYDFFIYTITVRVTTLAHGDGAISETTELFYAVK